MKKKQQPTSQSISDQLMGAIKETTEAMHPGSTEPKEGHIFSKENADKIFSDFKITKTIDEVVKGGSNE